jgi:hypothetical protein
MQRIKHSLVAVVLVPLATTAATMPLNRPSKPEAAGNSLLDNPEAAGNNRAGSKPEVARNRVVAAHSSTGRQSRPQRQGQRETHLQSHRTHVQNLLVQSHDEILHLRRGILHLRRGILHLRRVRLRRHRVRQPDRAVPTAPL